MGKITNGIKKRFEKAKIKTGRGATKCFVGISDHAVESNEQNALAFGSEVVIPLKVHLPTTWTKAYDLSHNEEIFARELNLTDVRTENALVQLVDYQKQLAKTYNQKVQHK